MSIIGDGIMLGAGGETASIVVTAPTGSTVTCTTPGGVVLTTKEVGGTWTFAKLKVYGAYTITATDGTKTATSDVVVDSAIEYAVEMSYVLWLYKDGNEYTDVTRGWVTWAKDSSAISEKLTNSMHLKNNANTSAMVCTNNTIDLTVYSKICIEYRFTGGDSGYGSMLDVAEGKNYSDVRKQDLPLVNNQTYLEANINSSAKGDYYIAVRIWYNTTNVYVYKIWLE